MRIFTLGKQIEEVSLLFNNAFVVAGKEFNRLRKSLFFWAGLVLISIAPELINNPIQDGRVLCTPGSVAYYVLYTAFLTDTLAIALLIGYICFYDDKTEMNSVILTQPISSHNYALGRFIAVFLMWLFLAMIRVIILLFVPLYFKAMPYSPIPFLKATLIYLLPAIFYFTALCYFILMISKSTIITTIVSVVWGFLQLSFLHNTAIDVNLEGKVQVFSNGEKLTRDFATYFVTNRILLILIGILFLSASIFIYSSEKKRTKTTKKSKTSKLKLNYNFRIQSPVIRAAIIVVALACILLLIISKENDGWNKLKMFLSLIPLFLIVNVLSEEYVQNREGILFTCKTPIYKQMLTRILYAWIFSEVVLFICYLAAFINGNENNFHRFLPILIMSTFLSLLGLTASNLSKKPLLGFIVPMGYWIFFILQGAKFNETFNFVSFINLMLTSQMIWVNLISLSLISIVLLVFNIWYVGKGEKIRKPLLRYTFGVVVFIICIMGIHSHYIYNRSIVQSKLMNNKDTIYILDERSPKVEKFLQNKGVKYSIMENFNINNFGKNNIVFICNKNCKDIKKDIKVLDYINFNDDGLQINDFNIVDASCFRFTAANPGNNKKHIVFMQSKNWTDEELNLLFNEKKGNFIAAKGNSCLFESNYNLKKDYSMTDNLKIHDEGAWLMKSKKDVKIMYRYTPKAKVTIDDLLDTWYVVHKELKKTTGEDLAVNTLQIYDRYKPINLSSNALKIGINDIRSFDAPQSSMDERWTQTIAVEALENIVFKNIKDEKIRGGWSEYLFYTRMIPAFKELKKEILDYNYKMTNGNITEFYGDYYKSLQEKINTAKNKTYIDEDNIQVAGNNILYSFDDKKDSLYKIVRMIYKSKYPINESQLEKMCSENYDAGETQSVFKFYDEVKETCGKYGGLGEMLKPLDTSVINTRTQE